MRVAQQKLKENIAEYLLYMFQIEHVQKYPILSDTYLYGSKYDFLVLVINENINCDELLNNSVILKFPIFFTLVLKTQNTSKNCNHLANEASSFLKEHSSYRYIFYEV